MTFTRTCAWVPVGDATLVSGFEDHLAENAADAAWLERIADAFAAAGGGSLSDGVLDVAGASRLPRELERVLDPSSTTVEVAAAWRALGLSGQDVDALPLTTKLQLAGLDGLPAAVRDTASRAVLRAAVADPGRVYRMLGLPYTYGAVGLEEFTRQVEALRDGLERADQSAARLAPPSAQVAQLVGFGASNGALVAAISLGDLDTASNVTVNVPGATTTVGSAPEKVRAAHGLLSTAARQGQESSFAVVSWFGYRAPSFPEVPGQGRASTGGANLASFLDGTVDSRADSPPRSVTVLGHSYGSTTAAEALAQTRHRIDSFVTYGSVGFTDATKPDQLNVDRVFATEGQNDHVAALGRSTRTDPRNLPEVEVFSSEAAPVRRQSRATTCTQSTESGTSRPGRRLHATSPRSSRTGSHDADHDHKTARDRRRCPDPRVDGQLHSRRKTHAEGRSRSNTCRCLGTRSAPGIQPVPGALRGDATSTGCGTARGPRGGVGLERWRRQPADRWRRPRSPSRRGRRQQLLPRVEQSLDPGGSHGFQSRPRPDDRLLRAPRRGHAHRADRRHLLPRRQRP
ncbi:alpha/beta hydrolase family protein [Curtobacterium sp. L6-1]|uniref:Alpha/beta hydrolase family protein n=1 Tax=Curtobacterium aetherium TaxID=2841594 RepID=A0ACD1E0J7_9MICO|nr:alpha/beta hydrolase family protein [Curtobacterium sp. L6-1]